MKIQFIGAAYEVTGSCTLIEVGGRHYLVDCGAEQGIDVFQNVNLPVPAGDIEAVFLTHAHIDHSGMLPRLYKNGFRGIIYSTVATKDLADIMLRDSAHIQMMEAQWKNKKAERAGEEPIEPTYNLEDAEGAINLFEGVPYLEMRTVSSNVKIRFNDIGHLLGSSAIEIFLKEGDTERKIVFSGDVGNKDQPIIKNPKSIAQTDYLVLESTYGNRIHERPQDTVETLAQYLNNTFRRGGNVIIPSFAVGRTQELLYAIREIKERKLVEKEDFTVYVDSPLAVEATGIFRKTDIECFDEETKELLKRGIDPISFDGLKLSVTADESRAINENQEPKVIISASGMCEAGRIRHHLKHNLYKPQNLILFVGYQAADSLGRALLEGRKKVHLFGEEIAVRAEIRSLKGTSGHADKLGLIEWLQKFEKKPKIVFLNHGTEDSINDFKDELQNLGYAVETPYSGTEYDLVSGVMTAYTEQKRIEKTDNKSKSRQKTVYNNLLGAVEALQALVKRSEGRANKDNAKLTSQIRTLIDKWER